MAQEYTKTDRWKVLRKECLSRADNRCQLCNGTERLAAHHRLYDDKYEEGCKDSSDLVALCHRCHFWFHASQQRRKLNTGNKVARWKGKKEARTKEEDINERFPSGLEHRLEVLVAKHINQDSVTTKEFKEKILVLKQAIMIGVM